MKVLLINPKKRKRSKAMKKRRTKRKKTTAVATAKVTTNPKKRRKSMKRRKIRARRNPVKSANLLSFAIGGVTGIITGELVDRVKPMVFPYSITAGDVVSIGVGYLMVKKGKGSVKEIGKVHLGAALGKTVVKIINSFRANLSPTGTEGYLEGYGLEYSLPEQFQMQELSESTCCVETL